MGTKISINGFTLCRYFWRVLVSDRKNHEQIAFDYYGSEEGVTYNGVRELIIR
jgi:hypothetical protein